MKPPPKTLAIGLFAGIASGALWGGVFIAPKILAGFGPLELAAARYLVYGLVSALLLAPRWRKATAGLTRADWLALVRLSLESNIVYYVALVLAIQLSGIAVASLVVGMIPIVVTLVGSREAGGLPLRTLALPLALIGLGMVLINVDLFAAPHAAPVWSRALGLGGALVALACWAGFAIDNARYLARLPHVSGPDWSLLTGIVTGLLALVLAVPAFLFASHAELGAADWAQFWLVNAGVAITASVIGNALWNLASRALPLTLSGQMIIFETLFALLYGFIWDQRLPRPAEALAVLALVGGVWLSVRRHRGPA